MALLSRAAQWLAPPPKPAVLYFDLLPSPLRKYIDDLLKINSWRHSGTLVSEFNYPAIARRFILANGEEAVICMNRASQDVRIRYLDRKPPVTSPPFPGTFVRVIAGPPGADPLLIFTEDGRAMRVYRHDGVVLAERCVARQDSSLANTTDKSPSHARDVALLNGDWVRIETSLYRLPHLDQSFPMPLIESNSNPNACAVFGADGKERLAIVIEWPDDKGTLMASVNVYDLRSRQLLCTLPPLQALGRRQLLYDLSLYLITPVEDTDMHRIYSLLDGSLIAKLQHLGNRVCTAQTKVWFANEQTSTVTYFDASNNTVGQYHPPDRKYVSFIHCVKTRVIKYYHSTTKNLTYLLDVASGKGVAVTLHCDTVHTPWFHSDCFFYVTITSNEFVVFMAPVEGTGTARKILQIKHSAIDYGGWPFNATAPFGSSAHGPLVIVADAQSGTLYRCPAKISIAALQQSNANYSSK